MYYYVELSWTDTGGAVIRARRARWLRPLALPPSAPTCRSCTGDLLNSCGWVERPAASGAVPDTGVALTVCAFISFRHVGSLFIASDFICPDESV